MKPYPKCLQTQGLRTHCPPIPLHRHVKDKERNWKPVLYSLMQDKVSQGIIKFLARISKNLMFSFLNDLDLKYSF